MSLYNFALHILIFQSSISPVELSIKKYYTFKLFIFSVGPGPTSTRATVSTLESGREIDRYKERDGYYK